MQTYAYEFVRELASRGYQVTVLTRAHEQGEVEVPGAKTIPLLVGRRQRDWTALRAVQVDAWHVMSAAYSWLALETGPVVASVHGNDFLDPYPLVERPNLDRVPMLWRMLRRAGPLEIAWGRRLTYRTLHRSLPRIRHILANSRYTERVLLQHYPECKGRTSAGMVGVADRFFRPRAGRPADNALRLITVSRLTDRRKNVDIVIRALARLKDKYQFRYTVVGDGELRAELEQLARALDVGDRVNFVGFVSAEEVCRLLAESDLFVLVSSINPGSHEGFGIAYLEANACGTPVLAARLAGAVEAVNENETGMFVDRPDVDTVAEVLGRFLSGQLRFDAEACRRFAREFSWSKVVDRAVAWYEPRAGESRAANGRGM